MVSFMTKVEISEELISMKNKIIAIMSSFFFLHAGSLFADTCYMSTTGNDTSGTGSEVAPFLTLQHSL